MNTEQLLATIQRRILAYIQANTIYLSVPKRVVKKHKLTESKPFIDANQIAHHASKIIKEEYEKHKNL